ncbi:MAG: hypothetical protein QOG04_2194 [Actinomycetota bacterium]|jgi:hypothetical protein|nr:hypothetical protein [Actinomycetota bacterium]
MIAVVAVLVALLIAALARRSPTPAPTNASGFVDVALTTDTPGSVRLPASWGHVALEGRHGGVALATSPRAELLDGVVEGNGAQSLAGRQDLRLDDVYVEVWTSYQPVAGGLAAPNLGERVNPADFEPGQEKFGEPIFRYDASPEGGGLYSFMYWAGPEASEEDKEEMLAIILSLRFE